MQDALEALVHKWIVRQISELNLIVSPFQPQNASIKLEELKTAEDTRIPKTTIAQK